MPDLRFGLIGFGAWGRFHAASIAKAPGARLAAIAARSDAGAEAARQSYPDAAIHRDWQSLLADPDHRCRRHRRPQSPASRDRRGRPSMRASTCCSRSRWRTASRIATRSLRPTRQERQAAGDRPRIPAVDAMGPDQARHRGGPDRAAAACPGQPLPLSLSPGLRRLALRPAHGRLVDPRGAGPLLRHADVVLRGPGRPGVGAGLRQFQGPRARHVRQFLDRDALPRRSLCGREPDARGVRASSRRRDRRHRWLDPDLVVGHHGPDIGAEARAQDATWPEQASPKWWPSRDRARCSNSRRNSRR